MLTIDLPEILVPVSFLLGTWRGEGQGEYPTIKPFDYREEVRFWQVGKPFLLYTQRTQAADDGRPLHTEMGYLRVAGPDQLEFVVAQGTGFAEVDVGSVHDQKIELKNQHLVRTPTAKHVTDVSRTIWVEGDVLRYELSMAMASVPMTHHLSATLRRVSE
jgi:hypothetical protein